MSKKDMGKLKIVVIGAGSIGKRHVAVIKKSKHAKLVGIADNDLSLESVAQSAGVPFFPDFNVMLSRTNPDGAVISTPTKHHFLPAMAALHHGADLLIEKPISATVTEALKISEKAKLLNRKILVGHHRRYYPVMKYLRDFLVREEIGVLTALNGQWTTLKPANYFIPEWRKSIAAGPVLTNLIHEIDSLRFLCGEIEMISAEISNSVRKFEKEDTVAIIIRFKSGVIGSFLLSDGVFSPWTWESAMGENVAIPQGFQNTHRFCGTKGSVEFPRLRVWSEKEPGKGWNSQFNKYAVKTPFVDAYVVQSEHFYNVIRRLEEPITSAEDGTKTLAATIAVFESANLGEKIRL